MKVQHGSWKPDSAAILIVRPFQHTTLKTLIILFKQLQQNIFPKKLRVDGSSSMKGMFLWYKANGPWCGRAAMKAQNCQSQGCYNQCHPEPAASAQANPHCSTRPHSSHQHWAPQLQFLRELGVRSGTAHSNAPTAARFGSGMIVTLDMLKYCLEVDCAFSHQHYWLAVNLLL